jgi:apolipoprotein D and lipocalin family protein
MFSCSTIPKGAQAVQHFNKDKYLGKWYEIARMDFRFEKNLINTTAEYSLRNDGKIKVVNSGFSTTKNKNKTATGKAKFRGSSDMGALKVSFFGPFYAAYNIIALDENYQYALVAGKNLKYLWLLSREKTMPENVKKDYLQKAQAIGYNTADLVWVKQD